MVEPRFLDIRKVADVNITRSTIGFLDRSDDKVRSLGSATFVRFGRTSGLLTCAHVVHAFEERARRGELDIGVVMFPVRSGAIQNTTFKLSNLSITMIGEPPFDSGTGPDIAFISLPAIYVSTLDAQASIVNGDAQIERSKEKQPALPVIEVVAGVIEQWTTSEAKGGGRTLARVEALGLIGRVGAQRASNGFDLIDFEIDLEQKVTLPKSFAGTSGGGIWRLFYELDEAQQIVVKQRRLLGVAFFEKLGQPGQIIGHGPTTLYRDLKGKLPA